MIAKKAASKVVSIASGDRRLIRPSDVAILAARPAGNVQKSIPTEFGRTDTAFHLFVR